MMPNIPDPTGTRLGADMSSILSGFIERELLPPNCGVELGADDDLLDIGLIDSMQFMRLVQFSEETYSLTIPPEDLLIENFQSVSNLTAYLTGRLQRS